MGQQPTVRIRATIHYDGSGFAGWQLQPDRRTVQGSIEQSLASLLERPVRIAAAGRTDTGVHAVGQEIAFPAPARWSPPEMLRAFNAVADRDVWAERARLASSDFHPRFSATGRRYEYYVAASGGSLSPVRAGRVWRLARELDVEALQRSAASLTGERSFAALSKSGQPERGTRCTVEEAEWTVTPLGDLRFTVVADRFLHHMVRYLVAVMVDVATGRRGPGELGDLLEEAGTPRPPEPAPPEGLYLTGVRYPDGWNRAPGVPGLWSLSSADASSGT